MLTGAVVEARRLEQRSVLRVQQHADLPEREAGRGSGRHTSGWRSTRAPPPPHWRRNPIPSTARWERCWALLRIWWRRWRRWRMMVRMEDMLFTAHDGIRHAHHPHHGFHVVDADDVRSAGDAHRDGGSRPFQALVGRQVRGCSR